MSQVFHFCSYFFILNEGQVPSIVKKVCFHQCWMLVDQNGLSLNKCDELTQQMVKESNSKLSILLKELKIQKWYPLMGLVSELDFEKRKFHLYYYHDATLSVSLKNQLDFLNDYNLTFDNLDIYSANSHLTQLTQLT